MQTNETHMRNRPTLQLKPTRTDRILDAATFTILFTMWALVVTSFNSLPDTIPVHFNYKGEIDRYGSKGTLFILPVITSILTISMYYLNKVPHLFNYMVEITEENAERHYRRATRVLRWANAMSTLLMLAIVILVLTQTL